MRSLVALFATCVLAACSTASAARDPAPPPSASANAAVEFLLASAASDFNTHRDAYPARFRNVRSGYFVAADGTPQYRLCGEFQPARQGGEAAWVRFATVKTSSYEHWVGGQAAPFCDAPMTWDEGDLSSVLQSRLDAQR